MPFDSWGSHLENDIGELEEYIQAIEDIIDFTASSIHPHKLGILRNLMRNLQQQKERKEYELRTHRQRDKERGIKY